ncbi:MAG: transporter substrate-binding domain-containing protein [Sulfuricellaceae bacterium]
MKTIIIISSIIIGLLIGPAWAEPILVLNSPFYAPVTSAKRDGVLDQVYLELSKRVGVTFEIHSLPAAERALINVNDGIVDGDVARVPGLEKKYPNMMRVPAPVMRYEMVVFSRDVDFKVAGADSIKPYNVGLVRGWKILEQAATGAKSVTTLESAEQMFSMLDKNRIDIALLEKLEGLQIVASMGINGIKVLQPNLLEGYWYLYLNKKHEALIPRIAAELRKMEKDGTLTRIYESVLSRYAR